MKKLFAAKSLMVFLCTISSLSFVIFAFQNCNRFAPQSYDSLAGESILPPGNGGATVHLTWEVEDFSLQDSFEVQQSSDGVSFQRALSVAGDQLSANISGLHSGQTYYFRLRAISRGGQSDFALGSFTVP